MKKCFLRALIVLLLLQFAFIAVTCVKPPGGHFDFNLRMNEIQCVLNGVNPFQIWNEEIVLPPYVSNFPKKPTPEGCIEQVNAYAPWEYVYMMPLSFLPRHIAWFVYCIMMGFAVFCVGWFSRPLEGEDDFQWGGDDVLLLISLPLAMTSYLIWSNASVGNFIVFVMAFSVLLAKALAKGNWLFAGVSLAVTMIKPQSAILFVLPLLMRGKWRTCFIAGGLCFGLSLVPAFLCDTSVFNLLIQGPAANAELFEGCGTWPKFLCGYFSNETDIAIGLTIGVVLCLWMTWMLRREKDWLVYLMPAAVCSSCWTYTQAYSHAMGWFLAYAITKELLHNPRSKAMWILAALSLIALPRFILAWHGLYSYMGWQFPMSEFMYRSIDSLNSSLTLGLAAIFCVIVNRQNSPSITA